MNDHPNSLILDAMIAFLQDAPRDPDGALTQQAQADLHKIADLAKDPDSLLDLADREA